MKTIVSVRLSPERLAQVDTVAHRLGTTRSGAIDTALRILPDLLSGKSELKYGPFGVVEIRLGSYGEAVSRELLLETYQSRQEASEKAAELAATYQGGHGPNHEHGYWWGRSTDGKVTRFIVEARP
ncbi:MAG: hypothetical protein WBB34_12460 [Xanthobacteraceae bacterium]